MLRRLTFVVVTAGVLFYALAAAALFFYQNKLVYFPRRYDSAFKPGGRGIAGFREYRAADGKVNYGYLIKPADASLGLSASAMGAGSGAGADPPAGAANGSAKASGSAARALDPADRAAPLMYLVFLGNASTAMDAIDEFEALANATGVGFFMVDYRGYGFNDGAPTEAGMTADALGAYDTLAADGWFARGAGVIGVSIGGGAAFAVADMRPVDRLMTIATFTSLDPIARSVVGWPLCLISRNHWPNDERLARILARPAEERPAGIVLFHDLEDEVVPFSHGRRLADIGGAAVDFRVRHGDHQSILGSVMGELRELIARPVQAARPGEARL